MASSRRLAVLLVLTAAVHAACWTPPTAVRGRLAAQRKTVLLVDQAAPFRVTMRPDAAGALGIEVDANESGAAVIKSIVRGSRVSELLEVGDAPQPGCTRAPPVQATAVHRPGLLRQRACQPATWHRAAQAGTERPHAEVTRRAPRALCASLGERLPSPTAHRAAPRTARCTALCTAPVEVQVHGGTRPLSTTYAPLSTTSGGGPGQRVRHADTGCGGGRRLCTGQPATAKSYCHLHS